MQWLLKIAQIPLHVLLSYKQNIICRDDAVNMQNQWIEIAPIFRPPFVYFPSGQGLFYVHWALINSAPFAHTTGPTARHYRPHPLPIATCVSHSHLHTRTHKHSRNCFWVARKQRRLCTFRLKRQPYNCEM